MHPSPIHSQFLQVSTWLPKCKTESRCTRYSLSGELSSFAVDDRSPFYINWKPYWHQIRLLRNGEAWKCFKTASNEKEASCWSLLFLCASSNPFSTGKSNKKFTQGLPISILCTKSPKWFSTWCAWDRLRRKTALLLGDCLGTPPSPEKSMFS